MGMGAWGMPYLYGGFMQIPDCLGAGHYCGVDGMVVESAAV